MHPVIVTSVRSPPQSLLAPPPCLGLTGLTAHKTDKVREPLTFPSLLRFAFFRAPLQRHVGAFAKTCEALCMASTLMADPRRQGPGQLSLYIRFSFWGMFVCA